MIQNLPLIALGGAIGAVLRALAVAFVPRVAGFPLGVMVVNILGGALMGLCFIASAKLGPKFAPLMMTGVLGGFTTFSAFTLDLFQLLERGSYGMAATYLLGSVGLSFAGFCAAVLLMRGVLA